MMDKELRAKGKLLKPTINVGKSGLTKGIVDNIKLQLKKRKLIKVKILRTVEDKKKMVDEIIMHTDAELVQKIGNVIVLHKK